MNYPSTVTICAKRDRRMLAGRTSRFYASDKRALKRRARALVHTICSLVSRDPSHFDGETFQVPRYTGRDVV